MIERERPQLAPAAAVTCSTLRLRWPCARGQHLRFADWTAPAPGHWRCGAGETAWRPSQQLESSVWELCGRGPMWRRRRRPLPCTASRAAKRRCPEVRPTRAARALARPRRDWDGIDRLAPPATAGTGCPAHCWSCRRTCHGGDRCSALRVEPTAVDERGQPPPVAADASGSKGQRVRGWPISTRRPAASTPNGGDRFAGRPPRAVSAAQICASQLRQPERAVRVWQGHDRTTAAMSMGFAVSMAKAKVAGDSGGPTRHRRQVAQAGRVLRQACLPCVPGAAAVRPIGSHLQIDQNYLELF
jgi:hypothetical protein